ncbi:MAG: TolC family protein [Chitinophagales bacterium]|nr:TolC family protein [Chitinophagales bacterium]
MNKLLATLALMLIFFSPLFTQMDNLIHLEECYEKAWQTHPLSEKGDILDRLTAVQLDKISTDELPNISWNAQASMQTETVEFPFEIPIPNFTGLDLPLYRMQTTLDAQYTLYDGGVNDARKAVEQASLLSQKAEIELSREPLKEKINELVFGILMQRKRLEILDNSRTLLESQYAQVKAGVRHGIILPSVTKELDVELLRLDSEMDQANASIRALISSLSYLIGEPIPENVEFELPIPAQLPETYTLQRPELALFEAQQSRIMTNEQLIEAKQKPKLGAFVQTGLGLPNPLNFFDNTLSPFAIGGLKFSWNIIDWKQSDRDRQVLSLQAQLIDNQQAAFEHQLAIGDERYREEILALESFIQRDKAIIQLQSDVLSQKATQLREGVITSAEYITQATALRQASLILNQHELQLARIKIEFLTQKGLL